MFDDSDMTSYRMSLMRHRRKTFLLCQETGMKTVGKDAHKNRQNICRFFCVDETNERALRLLEFVTFNDLVLANTFGHHKASRRWTWHGSNRQHHNQIDYILDYTLVRKRCTQSPDHHSTAFSLHKKHSSSLTFFSLLLM